MVRDVGELKRKGVKTASTPSNAANGKKEKDVFVPLLQLVDVVVVRKEIIEKKNVIT